MAATLPRTTPPGPPSDWIGTWRQLTVADTRRILPAWQAVGYRVQAVESGWAALEAANAPYPRRAQFRCTLVLAWPDGHDEVFEGVMPGQVVWPMRGDQGHGYDPIFQPDGHDVTFGEMDRWAKNQISHRADAFRKLVEGCFT